MLSALAIISFKHAAQQQSQMDKAINYLNSQPKFGGEYSESPSPMLMSNYLQDESSPMNSWAPAAEGLSLVPRLSHLSDGGP